MNNWGFVTGVRIYVGFVPAAAKAPAGVLTVTHGFDGKTFEKKIPAAALEKGSVTYTVSGGAKVNDFIRMTVK